LSTASHTEEKTTIGKIKLNYDNVKAHTDFSESAVILSNRDIFS